MGDSQAYTDTVEWNGVNSGSNYVVTVTYRGGHAGTITLQGITTASEFFDNLNVVAMQTYYRPQCWNSG